MRKIESLTHVVSKMRDFKGKEFTVFEMYLMTNLFLVVWQNASNEVRRRVSERLHELRELLLVELADCSEHPSLHSCTERRCCLLSVAQSDDLFSVFPQLCHQRLRRRLQNAHYVLVQWVHVLREPLHRDVVHLTCTAAQLKYVQA